MCVNVEQTKVEQQNYCLACHKSQVKYCDDKRMSYLTLLTNF